MTKRYILHLHVDTFFASVEEILDPSLNGKPFIVGARPEQRGVVASASYTARAFGVHSAMPTAQALRLCPQTMVLPPRHKVYREYSARVMAILSEYSPLIKPLSLDEAFPSTALRRRSGQGSGQAPKSCRPITGHCCAGTGNAG